MFIQKNELDILLITEEIPKSQVNPITDAQLKVGIVQPWCSG